MLTKKHQDNKAFVNKQLIEVEKLIDDINNHGVKQTNYRLWKNRQSDSILGKARLEYHNYAVDFPKKIDGYSYTIPGNCSVTYTPQLQVCQETYELFYNKWYNKGTSTIEKSFRQKLDKIVSQVILDNSLSLHCVLELIGLAHPYYFIKTHVPDYKEQIETETWQETYKRLDKFSDEEFIHINTDSLHHSRSIYQDYCKAYRSHLQLKG